MTRTWRCRGCKQPFTFASPPAQLYCPATARFEIVAEVVIIMVSRNRLYAVYKLSSSCEKIDNFDHERFERGAREILGIDMTVGYRDITLRSAQ